MKILDTSVQQTLIQKFKHQELLDIVDQMSPDDRARLFDELPAKVVRRLRSQLSPGEWQATALLLGYEEDTGRTDHDTGIYFSQRTINRYPSIRTHSPLIPGLRNCLLYLRLPMHPVD